MNDFYKAVLIALLPALIISLVTAYLTVKLSLRQFYSQKWWEKKAEKYSVIIEELSYLQYYYGELYDDSIGIKPINNSSLKGFENDYSKAKQLIMKSYAAGAFIISDNSIKALTSLVKEIETEKFDCHFSDNYGRWYDATKKCIEVIREEAKKELRKR